MQLKLSSSGQDANLCKQQKPLQAIVSFPSQQIDMWNKTHRKTLKIQRVSEGVPEVKQQWNIMTFKVDMLNLLAKIQQLQSHICVNWWM